MQWSVVLRKGLVATPLTLKTAVLCFLSLVAVSSWSDVSKISELVDAGAIQATDEIPLARAGGNFKYTGLKGALDAKENAGTAASAVSTHEALSDPHTVYLTVSEADALYEAAGAVSTHAGEADPHPGYLTQAEGDARYSLTTHTHAGGGGEAFPVGSVFIAVVDTDPATLLGYGTWAAFAAGRMLVGVNSGDTDFDTAEETGGSKTSSAVVNHTHPVNITDPQHAHVENLNSATTGGLRGATPDTSTNTSTATGFSTAPASTGITATTSNPAGGVASFSLMNPYIAVYMWKRLT